MNVSQDDEKNKKKNNNKKKTKKSVEVENIKFHLTKLQHK